MENYVAQTLLFVPTSFQISFGTGRSACATQVNVQESHPPEAARDRSVVKAISLKVRATMQDALDEMVSRRRSIFWGSTFESEEP